MTDYAQTATGEFQIEMHPGDGLIAGTGRVDFTKQWTGELRGTGVGVMLSAGDPTQGTAGYVAIERFEGSIGERTGAFCFTQRGRMTDGTQDLHYELVPGSGQGELTGIDGVLELVVDADGVHHVTLRYDLP